MNRPTIQQIARASDAARVRRMFRQYQRQRRLVCALEWCAVVGAVLATCGFVALVMLGIAESNIW